MFLHSVVRLTEGAALATSIDRYCSKFERLAVLFSPKKNFDCEANKSFNAVNFQALVSTGRPERQVHWQYIHKIILRNRHELFQPDSMNAHNVPHVRHNRLQDNILGDYLTYRGGCGVHFSDGAGRGI